MFKNFLFSTLLILSFSHGGHTMEKSLDKVIFNINDVQEVVSPLSEGILFKPMLHPNRQDGSAIDLTKGVPQIHHSTALFTIKPGYGWPKTIFKIAEIYFIIEGKGEIEIDSKIHPVKKGDVIFVAPGLERAIRNNGNVDLLYLSITDPEWIPDAESQLSDQREIIRLFGSISYDSNYNYKQARKKR